MEPIKTWVEVPGRMGSLLLRVQRFDDVSECYREAEKCEGILAANGRSNDRFYGHTSEREAVKYCREGITETAMKPARGLVNKIDASFREREREAWEPSPYGAFPIVPDYLAGDPFSMRMKRRDENPQAPIRYYIEAVVSAGVNLRQLERRAAAVAALIMRTAEDRPVELYVLLPYQGNSGQGYIGIVPIQTHPIDLQNTIAAFATREFCRAIGFSLHQYHTRRGETSHWLFGHPEGYNRVKRDVLFRRVLDANPQDVIMQGGYLDDAALMDSDPVAWVHKQIEKQRTIKED